MHDQSPGVLLVWRGFGRVYGGGVERFLEQSLRYLTDFGFEPYILDLSGGTCSFGPDFDHFSDRIIDGPESSMWPTAPSFNLQRTWARLRKLNIRLAVFHEPADLRKVGYLPQNLPVLLVCHSDPLSPDYYKTIKRFAPRVAGFVCVSDVIAAKLHATLAPTRSKIRKIRMGIEPICFKRRSKADVLRIVYVGRLENESKRIMDIVPFIEELEALRVDYRLSIIGDGDKKHLLKNRLDRLDVGSRVKLLGGLRHREAMKRLSRADALVLFSQYEGLPFCVLEALSYSVVPIVTRLESGFSEILRNNANALFFDVGHPLQAAQIVKSLADDPELLSKLQCAAGAAGARFSVDETMKSFADLFFEITAVNPVSIQDWDWRRAWRPRIRLKFTSSTAWKIMGWFWHTLPLSLRRPLRRALTGV